MSDEKFWISIWTVTCITIILVSLTIAWGNTIETRTAIKAGLVQVEYKHNFSNGTDCTKTKWVRDDK